MDEEKINDEEITVDLSNLKKWFKRKNKGEDVQNSKQEVQKPKKELDKVSEEKIKEDKKEYKKTYHNVQEAKQIDAEDKNLEKPLGESKKEVDDSTEEISIDFGKIKNLFKSRNEHKSEKNEEHKNISRDKKPTKKEIRDEQKESEEEISFDVSKIKGLFKGASKKEDKTEESKEEDSIDIKKLTTFAKKYYPVFLILIPLLLSTYLRFMPAYLPITDDWAQNSVYNYYKSQIKTDINKQYPNLPDDSKNNLIDAQFQKMLKDQGTTIQQQITGTSTYFKSTLQDDRGQTYLLELDPYFWMMYANDILVRGYPGDVLRNRKTLEPCFAWQGDCVPWDTHMLAPKGRETTPDLFHPYFEVFVYDIAHFFNKDRPLKEIIFYIPILIVGLAIIPVFFITRRIAGNFGGLIAGIIIAMNPSLLTRTIAGFSDTDAYNVLFPLLITWLFLIAFEAKNTRSRLISSALAGFFVGLYSFAWTGWWYIFDFLIGAAGLYILYILIIHAQEFKKGIIHLITTPVIRNIVLIIIIFFVFSCISTVVFRGYDTFTEFASGPFDFATLKTIGIDSVWPNVFTTVAEQNPGNFSQIVDTMGGSLLFVISLIGIALTLTKKDNQGKIDTKYAIILTIWLIATIYASIKGVRYMLMILPAFSIACGVAFGIIYSYVSQWISKELKVSIYISKGIMIFLLCLLLISPFMTAEAAAKNEIPSINKAWYSSLDEINKNATKNAIINSWWDMGHWFKAVGGRAVTFDGASQNTPMAHWIGNVLLTDNEDVAVGILRMLDCGSNDAFEEMDAVLNDTTESVNLLYKIIVLDKPNATKILKNYVSLSGKKLTDDKINRILNNTHCNPPEDYFITSDDMIGKSGVWAHFGSWNFDKAFIYNTLTKKAYRDDKEKSLAFLKTRFNYSDDQAENTYYEVESITSNDDANNWIAPWPSYATTGVIGCTNLLTNQSIRCDFGQFYIDINLTTMQADVPTQQGIMHPNSIVYPIKNGLKRNDFNNTIGMSLVLIPLTDGTYNSIIMHPALAESMFTRLYFMNGHGLTHFKLFSYQRSATNNQIYVWKVDWEGKEKNILDVFKPKEINNQTQGNNSNIQVKIE